MHRHAEKHFAEKIGWLRAAVMGANDGIVSTASLIVGVAAAQVARDELLIAGMAGLVAGAMSMAAGEFVSVSSQADSEKADLAREKQELEDDYEHEHIELASIYEGRGLEPKLAREVATQLMQHDALGAHARDELGLHDLNTARPVQAAVASAITFALGASLPLLLAWLAPAAALTSWVAGGSLLSLALLGAWAALSGGANIRVGCTRVTFWGAAAMAATYGIGTAIPMLG